MSTPDPAVNPAGTPRDQFERTATAAARRRHADAPHGTAAARVRAEVSGAMQEYDAAAHAAANNSDRVHVRFPAFGDAPPWSGDTTPLTDLPTDRRSGTDRRTGDDRRAAVPSPTGDRWRAVAESLDALADAAADHAPYAIGRDGSYAAGQEDAYRAAARIVESMAATEDLR